MNERLNKKFFCLKAGRLDDVRTREINKKEKG